MKYKNKKGVVQRETALWILAIIVLVIIAIIVFFLRDRGLDILKQIFSNLRFGQ